MARRKKTTHMLLIEAQNNRDIQEIMLSEFERFGTEKAAADMLNITQQTFNQWKFRLGIEEEIEQIRQERRGGQAPTSDEQDGEQ